MNWLILADTNGQQAPTVRPTLSERQASRSLPVHTASITMNLRSEEHTSELQSHVNLVCRLLLEKKKANVRRTAAGWTGRTWRRPWCSRIRGCLRSLRDCWLCRTASHWAPYVAHPRGGGCCCRCR